MIEPLCPYFGDCGGCSLQHLDYQQQLEQKKKNPVRITGFEEVKVFSGSEYGYRNRLELIFHPRGIGLRAKDQKNRIVDVEKCSIVNGEINLLIKEVRDFFRQKVRSIDSFDSRKKIGTFRELVIRNSAGGSSVSFVLNEDSSRLAGAIELVKEFAEMTTADKVAVTEISANSDETYSSEFFMVKGDEMMHEDYLGKTFFYHLQGFFQNNSFVAEKMQKYVRGLLESYQTSTANLLDLYSGVGTFGIINADLFKEVFLVESDKNCIEGAEKNIEQNQIKNVKAVLLDGKNLYKLNLSGHLFVITDPPRVGMDQKTIEQLNKLKSEVIVYVSCNPEQLGKDLLKFKDYYVRSVALFDLFPQTIHSEVVVELVRKQTYHF